VYPVLSVLFSRFIITPQKLVRNQNRALYHGNMSIIIIHHMYIKNSLHIWFNGNIITIMMIFVDHLYCHSSQSNGRPRWRVSLCLHSSLAHRNSKIEIAAIMHIIIISYYIIYNIELTYTYKIIVIYYKLRSTAYAAHYITYAL